MQSNAAECFVFVAWACITSGMLTMGVATADLLALAVRKHCVATACTFGGLPPKVVISTRRRARR
jgi:hypothetical protein